MEHFLQILFNESLSHALNYLEERLSRLETRELDEFFLSTDYVGDYAETSKQTFQVSFLVYKNNFAFIKGTHSTFGPSKTIIWRALGLCDCAATPTHCTRPSGNIPVPHSASGKVPE